MNEIKLLSPKPGVELCAVKLPEGCKAIRVERGNMLIVNQDHRPAYDDHMFLPEDKWKLIGTLDQITEDQSKELVIQMQDSGYPFEHQDARETLIDFLQANGVYEISTPLTDIDVAQSASTGSWLILRRV